MIFSLSLNLGLKDDLGWFPLQMINVFYNICHRWSRRLCMNVPSEKDFTKMLPVIVSLISKGTKISFFVTWS